MGLDQGEAEKGVRLLREAGLKLALAESCTGGLLGSLITDIPGSSEFFMGSVVSYSNDVKVSLLGVSPKTLVECGAVSADAAAQMAKGARERLCADVGLSITGIAGPGGGSVDKPVGTVFIGVSTASVIYTARFLLEGERLEVKAGAAKRGLKVLTRMLGGAFD